MAPAKWGRRQSKFEDTLLDFYELIFSTSQREALDRRRTCQSKSLQLIIGPRIKPTSLTFEFKNERFDCFKQAQIGYKFRLESSYDAFKFLYPLSLASSPLYVVGSIDGSWLQQKRVRTIRGSLKSMLVRDDELGAVVMKGLCYRVQSGHSIITL